MLDAQMKRGLLENCVLAALARGDSYGYQIVLYPILRRLEGAGALTVYSVEHNGRLRKFYHLTEAGRLQLERFAADWGEIAAMYDFIREGLGHE